MRITKDNKPNLGLLNATKNKINPSRDLMPNQFPEKNSTIILQKTSPNNNIPIKVKLVKANQNQNQSQLVHNKYNKLQSSPPKKVSINHIYKDQSLKMSNNNKLCNSSSKILDDDINNNNNNINKTEINKLRHSLIYTKEKQKQNEKDEEDNQSKTKNTRKYISMSPKINLRFRDENDDEKFNLRNQFNRGFVIQKNKIDNKEEIEQSDTKTTDGSHQQHEHKIRNLLSKNFPYNKKKASNKIGNFSSIQKRKSGEENKAISKNNNLGGDDNMSVSSFNVINKKINDNNVLINSPRTTTSFIADNNKINSNINNNLRNTQQNRYYKTSVSPNRTFNMNRTTYNYYNNNQNMTINNNNNNIMGYNNNNINNTINNNSLDIKLEDLIMIEERLNDICISLDNTNDLGASNECIEFFVFYFHSSLTYKFPLLFHESKRILIQSAINLKLFTIVMTYHLSMNVKMFSDVLLFLKKIYSLLKLNLYLLIKKLQMFYGEVFVNQNIMYFKTFNCLLVRNGYNNMNENGIGDLIQNNCYKIVQSLSDIINYYESIGNIYYLDFLELFNNISKLTEKEINNYFYNYLYACKGGGQPPSPRIEYHPLPARMRNNFYINNQTINNFNNININTLNNINDINNINRNINNQMRNQLINSNKNINKNKKNLLYEYQKNKISPPFIINPCNKKYTLVLDLTDTLINIQYSDINNQNLIPNFRPGLFCFLNSIKPFYELVSFTDESKEYSDNILKEIEKNNKKYFDYNLCKDHTTFYRNHFVKDISKLGRDIKKIIIVDDDPTNFELNPDNGIQISPYLGDSTKDDTTLFELKKLLILFNRTGGDDIRKVIKNYEKDIRENISMNNSNKKFQ